MRDEANEEKSDLDFLCCFYKKKWTEGGNVGRDKSERLVGE